MGSSKAILSALYANEKIGLTAISITALDELAFIHLQVVGDGSSKILSTHDSSSDIASVLATHIPRTLSLSPIVLERHGAELARRAGDYTPFVGTSRELPKAMEVDRIVIWLSWEMNRVPSGMAPVVRALQSALTRKFRNECDGSWEIEYIACREVSNSLIRGKAKLSLLFACVPPSKSGAPLTDSLSLLCRDLEDGLHGELAQKSLKREDHGVRRISIHWREAWLGHWSSALHRPDGDSLATGRYEDAEPATTGVSPPPDVAPSR